jgi:hypothetical protein
MAGCSRLKNGYTELEIRALYELENVILLFVHLINGL